MLSLYHKNKLFMVTVVVRQFNTNLAFHNDHLISVMQNLSARMSAHRHIFWWKNDKRKFKMDNLATASF